MNCSRKALVVGIDYYDAGCHLRGCVNDAKRMQSVLNRNEDGSVNFAVKTMLASDKTTRITRRQLKDAVEKLFSDDSEVALLYVASHGYIDSTGGYLVTSDVGAGDEGLSMDDVLNLANNSPAKSRVIILDCCHAGKMGNVANLQNSAILNEGVTILAGSTAEQNADEYGGFGVYTSLLIDALNGAAANLVGDVTPGSAYALIDQTLGPWEQRPVFKTNVKNFVSLRKAKSPLEMNELRQLTELFPKPDYDYPLDPSYEPESGCPKQENMEKFRVLQHFNRVNMVVPFGEPADRNHMYFAAMDSKSCRLTALGKHYWNLVNKGHI